MQRGALMMTLVLTLALLACKKGNEGDTKPTTTATPEATGATAAPPGATATPAVGKPPSFKVGDVPEIPSEKSNPPQGAEWNQGVAVNTQGANSRGKRCSMFVLREWLNIYCTGKVIGYEKKEDFGQINVDYYEKIVAGKYASFVIRLKKGHYPKIRICREKDRASLFVNWPPTKDKPMHVALGAGPECDGSDWGVGYGKKGGDSMKAKAGADDSDDDAYMQQLKDNDERAAKACSAGDTEACWTYCGAANCS
ncbi:MAG: hypothetical protein IPI67_33575 [Myxococcales bacterium]|nr:hypothetical protein [Myxococcales bacterium]